MANHLQREMDTLKKRMLALAAIVEESLQKTTKAIQELDQNLARDVIEADREVDHLEVQVEEECLKALALYQPVAIDLRFIIAVLKLNNDLERIGDLAVNIAERVGYLTTAAFSFPAMIPTMIESVQRMLRSVLDSLVNMDADLAQSVRMQDDEVDNQYRAMIGYIREQIPQHGPERLEQLFALLDISRFLERIADHCTNIAEDVIYLVDGEIVRHRPRSGPERDETD